MADGDLERVQKGALRIILGDKYENYKNALEVTKLDSPEDRREKLCLRFAKQCLRHEKLTRPAFNNVKPKDWCFVLD